MELELLAMSKMSPFDFSCSFNHYIANMCTPWLKWPLGSGSYPLRSQAFICFLFLSFFQVEAQRPVERISDDIISDRTFFADTTYELEGFVFVKGNATLTIEAGCVIHGTIDAAGTNTKGTLIVTREGTINAVGTACSPIVFTSSRASGSRTPGDLGGLVILGEARINMGDSVQASGSFSHFTDVIEGGLTGDAADRSYGGNNDADHSGTLRYIRIEFAGADLMAGQPSNALTLAGVGSGTTIDHLQLSYSGGDALEVVGGKFDMSHLVTLGCKDDHFDLGRGYRGNIQHVVIYQESQLADLPSSNAWETENHISSFQASPRTAAVFSNVTLIGPKATGTPNPLHGSAAHIRRGAWMSVHNSLWVDHVNGLYIDGDDTYAGWNAGMEFKGNIMAGMTSNYQAAGSHTTADMDAKWTASNTNFASTSSVGLPSAYNTINDPDLLPASGSVLLSGADWTFTGAADFGQVTHRGAFGSDNWMENWSEWDPQDAVHTYDASDISSIVAVNHNQGVYEASFPPNPLASRWFIQWRKKGDASWRIKGSTSKTATAQRLNITPWFNTDVEYRYCSVYGTDTALGCIGTIAIPFKPMTLSTAEQRSARCASDSVLLRVGYAGGQGIKSILWSNGASSKRTYADQGETLSVTVTDATGHAETTSITAGILSLTSAAPSNVSTTRSGTIVTVNWDPSSMGSGQSLIGYRVQYRLRNTTAWTSTPITSNTSYAVDFAGGTPGNYEFSVVARYNDNGTNRTSARACFALRGVPTTKNGGADLAADAAGTAVYPNPATDKLFVAAANGSEISVMDMNGRVIAQNTVTNAEVAFDLSEVATGAYMVRIINGSDVTVEKFIKK